VKEHGAAGDGLDRNGAAVADRKIGGIAWNRRQAHSPGTQARITDSMIGARKNEVADGIGPTVAAFDATIVETDVKDWIALLKPRVMALVVFIGLIGLLVAPGHLHPVLAFTAVLCIAVAAGAAGAINMWYDRDIDALMRRTANRPIPGGRIAAGAALGYGVAPS
jgi:hypothetical protein